MLYLIRLTRRVRERERGRPPRTMRLLSATTVKGEILLINRGPCTKKRSRCCKTERAPTANKLVTQSSSSCVVVRRRLSPSSDSPGISPTGHIREGEHEQNIAHPHEKGETTCCMPRRHIASLPPSSLSPRPMLPRNFVRCNVALETCERSHQ